MSAQHNDSFEVDLSALYPSLTAVAAAVETRPVAPKLVPKGAAAVLAARLVCAA